MTDDDITTILATIRETSAKATEREKTAHRIALTVFRQSDPEEAGTLAHTIVAALTAAVEAERARCAGIPNVLISQYLPCTDGRRELLIEVRDLIAQGTPPWSPADFAEAERASNRKDAP